MKARRPLLWTLAAIIVCLELWTLDVFAPVLWLCSVQFNEAYQDTVTTCKILREFFVRSWGKRLKRSPVASWTVRLAWENWSGLESWSNVGGVTSQGCNLVSSKDHHVITKTENHTWKMSIIPGTLEMQRYMYSTLATTIIALHCCTCKQYGAGAFALKCEDLKE